MACRRHVSTKTLLNSYSDEGKDQLDMHLKFQRVGPPCQGQLPLLARTCLRGSNLWSYLVTLYLSRLYRPEATQR